MGWSDYKGVFAPLRGNARARKTPPAKYEKALREIIDRAANYKPQPNRKMTDYERGLAAGWHGAALTAATAFRKSPKSRRPKKKQDERAGAHDRA